MWGRDYNMVYNVAHVKARLKVAGTGAYGEGKWGRQTGKKENVWGKGEGGRDDGKGVGMGEGENGEEMMATVWEVGREEWGSGSTQETARGMQAMGCHCCGWLWQGYQSICEVPPLWLASTSSFNSRLVIAISDSLTHLENPSCKAKKYTFSDEVPIRIVLSLKLQRFFFVVVLAWHCNRCNSSSWQLSNEIGVSPKNVISVLDAYKSNVLWHQFNQACCFLFPLGMFGDFLLIKRSNIIGWNSEAGKAFGLHLA